jgi:hypothetical protein
MDADLVVLQNGGEGGSCRKFLDWFIPPRSLPADVWFLILPMQ